MKTFIHFIFLIAVSAAAQYGPGGQFSGVYQVSQFTGGTFDAKLQACISSMNTAYGGVCDARSFGASTLASTITIANANVHVLLPCATITTSHSVVVSAGVRNSSIEGCAYQGGSVSSGTQGGTVWVYTGSGNAFQVGDTTYAADTKGFRLNNINLNTASGGSAAVGLAFYRTQEIDVRNVYLNGNNSTGQTGIYLDGTGNYSGGTFDSDTVDGFNTGLYLTGHLSGSAIGDYANAGTFVRLHIDCPTSGGNPVSGTYGVNIAAGDGNTWTGGDVEGCSTMFHLGAHAVNNTIVGLRNENSTIQYQADSGADYNAVFSGGTLFYNDLIDNGAQNSFWDAFHHTVNGMKGDWYASQQDSTVTDHQRLGTGLGNERGRISEIQTDYGYRWQLGFGDGATGEQVWNLNDMLNNVERLAVQQYLSATANTVTNVVINNGGCYTSSTPPTVSFSGGGGAGAAGTAVMGVSTSCAYQVLSVTMTSHGSGYTSQPTATFSGSNQTTAPNAVAEITTAGSTNNQTVVNSAGTGAVVLNGSANAGTGGVVISSGGASPTQVANFDSSGDLSLLGNLLFYSGSTLEWEWECASSSVCALHDAGATTPANVFRAFPNGGTEIDSQSASAVSINNTSTAGTGGLIVYEGGSNYTVPIAKFLTSTIIEFPGLAAGSGYNCLQADTSGYITLTGSACGTSSTSGTVTSAALSVPTGLSVSGSPITGSGTFAVTWSNETANQVFAGPSSGTAATPGFRALVSADIPNNAANTTGNAATATKLAANTLGCTDGWDHLPCTVYEMGLTSESAATGSYATAYTTTAAGVYRITGNVYATTQSSTAFTVTLQVKESQTSSVSSHGLGVASATIGTSEGWNNGTLVTQNLASGTAITWETVGSGTNTSGVWNIDLIVERVK